MKHFAFVVAMAFIAFILVSCGGKESKTNDSVESTKTVEQIKPGDPDKIFGIEKGMIEYKIVTMGMPSTITMYWDNFGKKSFTKNTMEMMGVKTTSLMLNDGEFVYTWDATTKEGTKVKVVKSDNLNYNNMTKDVMDKYHISKEASQEIKGKMCDVYKMEVEGAKSKTWVWKGIVIKSETTSMNITITTEMTKMEEDASAPEGSFEVPAGIKFKEVSASAK